MEQHSIGHFSIMSRVRFFCGRQNDGGSLGHSIYGTRSWKGIVVVRRDRQNPAALGIISRHGIRKVRHFDTRHMWIQQFEARRSTSYSKVIEITNVADLMTEELSASDVEQYVDLMGSMVQDGLAELVARIATDEIIRLGAFPEEIFQTPMVKFEEKHGEIAI